MKKNPTSLLLCLLTTLFVGVAQAKEPPKTPAASAAASSPQAKPADQLLDINSASEKELAQLPKIGEARAAAIVKGRPYKGKDDLVRKKILSKDVYAGIKDQIIAKQDVKADAKAEPKKDAAKK